MYSTDEVVNFVQAAYNRGFTEGAAAAFDIGQFTNDPGNPPSDLSSDPPQEDYADADAVLLESLAKHVQELTESVQRLEARPLYTDSPTSAWDTLYAGPSRGYMGGSPPLILCGSGSSV